MHSIDTMPDEYAILNRSYFTKMTSRTNVEILKYRVIVTKGKSGTRVSI